MIIFNCEKTLEFPRSTSERSRWNVPSNFIPTETSRVGTQFHLERGDGRFSPSGDNISPFFPHLPPSFHVIADALTDHSAYHTTIGPFCGVKTNDVHKSTRKKKFKNEGNPTHTPTLERKIRIGGYLWEVPPTSGGCQLWPRGLYRLSFLYKIFFLHG